MSFSVSSVFLLFFTLLLDISIYFLYTHKYNVTIVSTERSLSMATYKISDILLKLAEMIEDDHTFVELNEYPEEDDSPAFLVFQCSC